MINVVHRKDTFQVLTLVMTEGGLNSKLSNFIGTRYTDPKVMFYSFYDFRNKDIFER